VNYTQTLSVITIKALSAFNILLYWIIQNLLFFHGLIVNLKGVVESHLQNENIRKVMSKISFQKIGKILIFIVLSPYSEKIIFYFTVIFQKRSTIFIFLTFQKKKISNLKAKSKTSFTFWKRNYLKFWIIWQYCSLFTFHLLFVISWYNCELVVIWRKWILFLVFFYAKSYFAVFH